MYCKKNVKTKSASNENMMRWYTDPLLFICKGYETRKRN